MTPTAVIAYNASDGSEDALALGLVVRRLLGHRLVVASIAADPLQRLGGQHTERVRQEAEEAQSSARTAIEDTSDVEFRTLYGTSAARALHEFAEAHEADLLVLGATHHRASAELFAPSVTHQTIQGAPCAVLVAPAGYRNREHPVLRHLAVAVDGSEEAHAALELATATAARTAAELEVLHSFQPAMATATLAAVSYAVPDFRDEARKNASGQVDRAVAAAHDLAPDVTVHGRTLEGATAETLIDASEHCDMLFLGSRGYGPVRRAMLGSVSGAVVRRARCPVWVLSRHH